MSESVIWLTDEIIGFILPTLTYLFSQNVSNSLVYPEWLALGIVECDKFFNKICKVLFVF